MAEMIKSVEYLELSMTSTATTSGMLTKGQNLANCVPFFTHRGSSNVPYQHHMDAWFSTATTGSGYLNFERCDSTDSIQQISAYVVEFDPSEVKVYQGELPTTIAATTTQYSTLSGTFNSERTAFVFYNRTGYQTSTIHSYYLLRGSVVTSSGTYGNQLSFYRPVASNTSVYGHYFAFESLTNKFKVTHNTFSATTDYNLDVGVLDPDNTFVLGSYCASNINAGYALYQLWGAYHSYDYQVAVSSNAYSGTTYINIQTVQFINTNGKFHTPRTTNLYNFTGTTTEKVSTIPIAVNLDYSIVTPVMMQGVTKSNASTVYCASQFVAIWLTSSTEYKLKRNSSSAEVYPSYCVIDWKGIEPRYYDITNNNPLASGISPVKSIEHLSASMDGYECYLPTTSGQDMSNCAVFRSGRYNIAGDAVGRRYFTSAGIRGDDIVVRRGYDGGTMYMDLEVVEFYPDQVRVQQGTFEISGGVDYVDVTISGVTLNKAFLVFNYVSNVSSLNYVREQFLRGRFTATTTLRFERESTAVDNFPLRGYYYVVEDLKNYWEVAHYVDISAGVATMYSNYSTHYTPYNTMYFLSSNTSSTNYIAYGSARAYYHSPSCPAAADRVASGNLNFDVEIVRFLDETRRHVHINDYTMTTTQAEVTFTYPSEFNGYEDYLSALPGNSNGATRTDGTSAANYPEAFHSMRLDKANKRLVVNRAGISSISSYGSGFVVNWVGSPVTIEETEYLNLGSFVRTIERFTYSGTDKRRIWAFGKGQDVSQCVPFISFKTGETSTDQEMFFGGVWLYNDFKYFIYENFWPADDYGGIDVKLTMVEFEPSQVKIQRGVTYMGNSVGTIDVTISAVNTSKAFVISYVHARDDVNTYPASCMICTSFTSSTNLQLYRGYTTGTIVVSWWIVECLQDQWEVTHVIQNNFTADTNVVFSLPEAKPANRTVGFASYATDMTSYYVGYWSFRLCPNYDPFGINSFSLNKYVSTGTIKKANVQVIEFSENSGVVTEIIYYDFIGTEATDDRTLTRSFDTYRAMIQPATIWPSLCTRSDNTAAAGQPEGYVRGEFLNNNTIRFSRSGHYSTSTYGNAAIIEWPMPTHEVGMTVSEGASFVVRDVRLHKTDTGEVLANLTTSGTETLTAPMVLYTSYSGSLYAVCFDDTTGSSYNGLIYTDVFPTLISGTFPYKEGWV